MFCDHEPATLEITATLCDCGNILFDGAEYQQVPTRTVLTGRPVPPTIPECDPVDDEVTLLTRAALLLPREMRSTQAALLQRAFLLCSGLDPRPSTSPPK